MITLYQHPFALSCQTVLITFNELDVPCDALEERRDFDREQLSTPWPPASIPVLRDGDQVVGESSVIIGHVAGARLVLCLDARLCDHDVTDSGQT
jgi:glutathione S-transferase